MICSKRFLSHSVSRWHHYWSLSSGTNTEAWSYSSSPTDTNDEPLGLRCQELMAHELGLNVPIIALHTERDGIAEIGNYFALLTATCAKFATDLKLMMQTEVGEASEPYVHSRGSSSTMPQKRNPIGSVYICSMASSMLTIWYTIYAAGRKSRESLYWICCWRMRTFGSRN